MLIGNCSEFRTDPIQQRIIEAAKRCLKRWGSQKSGVEDIAREAGVSPNTVYCHFESRDEVFRATLLQAGNEFAGRVVDHLDGFSTAHERVIEGVLFSLVNLRNEPYLNLVISPDLASMVNRALDSTDTQKLVYCVTERMLENEPRLKKDIGEISEISTRFLLSLLLVKSPTVRDIDETRAFLTRRLLPLVGL